MKTLKLASILSALVIASTAFADMSGNYEVITPDCSYHVFSQSKTAIVIADNTIFKVGFISSYPRQDGLLNVVPGFDYKVGTTKQDCRLSECQDTYIGAYSQNKNQFVYLNFQAETAASAPVLKKQVTFILKGDELTIVNGQKECLFRKISK